MFGLGASIAGTGAGAGAGRPLGTLSRRVDLCTTFHAGRAWTGGPSSMGGGVAGAGGGGGGSWAYILHRKRGRGVRTRIKVFQCEGQQ